MPDTSRIFIDVNNTTKTIISKIGINSALTKMDSTHYPLVEIFCEDDVAEFIIKETISTISKQAEYMDIYKLINIIISGSANNTYTNFIVQKRIYDSRKIKTGYACVLDGDMAQKLDAKQQRQYPDDQFLHFLLGNGSPDRIIVASFESQNNNATLKYHINNSDNHCLFGKMIELNYCTDKDEAKKKCFEAYIATQEGQERINALKDFIINTIEYYSLYF